MKTLNKSSTAAALLLTIILAACKQGEETPVVPTGATQTTVTDVTNVPSPVSFVTNMPAVVPLEPVTNAVDKATGAVLSPLEAKSHRGETATVRGKVFGVNVTTNGDVFINVGDAYPGAPFTAVCFQGKIPADDLKKLDGKVVSFTGPIAVHNGSTEIVLENASQISE